MDFPVKKNIPTKHTNYAIISTQVTITTTEYFQELFFKLEMKIENNHSLLQLLSFGQQFSGVPVSVLWLMNIVF